MRVSRINPIVTLTDAEASHCIDVLEDALTPEWLSSSAEHPLRRLWDRDDVTSSMELWTLGHSIQVMRAIAPEWTEQQVELLQKNNRNQTMGAYFEITALSSFASAGHTVEPTPRSFPGYDATVVSQRSRLRYAVSLKHYGISSHERSFRQSCRNLERTFAAAIAETGVAASLTIEGSKPWGEPGYKELEAFVCSPSLLQTLALLKLSRATTTHPMKISTGNWSLQFLSFPTAGLSLHHSNYAFSVVVPNHKNETRNLESKLEGAYTNFERVPRSVPLPRLLMLHIPQGSDMEALSSQTAAYLSKGAQASLDAIFLYQPSVSRNADTGKSALTIYLQEIEAPGCRIQGDDRRTIFFIGTLIGSPPMRFIDGWVAGGTYLYQAGNFFLDRSQGECRMIFAGPGYATVPTDACTVGDGLHIHEVKDDGTIISPKIAPEDKLELL